MPVPMPALLAGFPGSFLSERTVRVEINGTPYTVAFPVLDPLDTFYLIGDGSDEDAIKLFEDVLNDQVSGETFTLAEDGNGHILFDCDIAFQILGGHVDTTTDLAFFGLDNTSNHPPVATDNYTSPRQHGFGFFPLEDPDGDGLDSLDVVMGGATTISGQSRILKLNRSGGRTRTMTWASLDAALVRRELADDDHRWSNFELAYDTVISEGYEFRLYKDTLFRADNATYKTYVLDPNRAAKPWREATGSALHWDLTLAVIRTDD